MPVDPWPVRHHRRLADFSEGRGTAAPACRVFLDKRKRLPENQARFAPYASLIGNWVSWPHTSFSRWPRMAETTHVGYQTMKNCGEMQPLTTQKRLFFLGVIVVLVAHFVFIEHYGEPYPAIVMPNFEGSGSYENGAIEFHRFQAVFVTSTEEIVFSPRTLLSEFPDSLHMAIAYNCLTPITDSATRNRLEKTKTPLHRLRDSVFPGYRYAYTRRMSPEVFTSLQEWLRGRAHALLPGKQVIRVEIRWFREMVKFGGSRMAVARQPAGLLVISFRESALQ